MNSFFLQPNLLQYSQPFYKLSHISHVHLSNHGSIPQLNTIAATFIKNIKSKYRKTKKSQNIASFTTNSKPIKSAWTRKNTTKVQMAKISNVTNFWINNLLITIVKIRMENQSWDHTILKFHYRQVSFPSLQTKSEWVKIIWFPLNLHLTFITE